MLGIVHKFCLNRRISARELKKLNLKHEVHPMGTVFEGSLDEVLEAVKTTLLSGLKHAPRVILDLKADVRPGFENRIHQKANKINNVLSSVGDTQRS